MGGQDTVTIKDKIKTEMDNKVNTVKTNINTIVNNSITNTVNTTVANIVESESDATVNTNIVGLNMIGVTGDQSASKGGQINVTQSIDIKATTNAIISIIQNPNAINNIGNDIAKKINNDVTARTNLETLAKISKQTKDAGGPEEFVNNIMTKISNYPNKNDPNIENNIKDSVNTTIQNTIINETDITNTVNTSITNKTKQTSAASCNFNVQAMNTYLVNGQMKVSNQGEIDPTQIINIESLNKCLINLEMGNAITNNLSNNLTFRSSSSTTNTNLLNTNPNTTNPTTTNPTTVTLTPTTKVAIETNNNIIYISLGVAGLIIFLILIYFITSRRSGRHDNYEEQDGGSNINLYNNLYLYATLFTLFLFISSKSITMCGLILVMFASFVISSI